MSKYLYVIIPLLAMGAFIGFYMHESKKLDEEYRIKAEADAAKAKADAVRLEQMREQSRIQAKLDAEKRDAEQRKKDDEIKAKYEADLKKLLDEAAGYVSDQNSYKAQIADLQSQIDKLRGEKENLSRQAIAMNQTIVSELINRQNAETQVQLYAARVARQVSDSPLARPPPPPPTTTTAQ